MEVVEETKTCSQRPINYKIVFLFTILLIALVYLFFALETVEAKPKDISLVINGLSTDHTTTQQTVGEFIDEIYPDTNQIISIFPDRNKELSSQDVIFVKTNPAEINQTVAVNIQKEVEKAKEIEKAKEEPEPKSLTYVGTATWYRWGDTPTTASTQFPRGTKLRVIATNSGKTIDVIVNDYGPEAWTGVALDLNSIAFAKLAPLGAGKIPIKYYVI